MIEWFKKIFTGDASSSTAKERLRLVLMTDHLALAPEIIENMKRDLVEVISRYVEVDRDKVEVNFEREDRALAMLANIPITSVNRPAPPAPLDTPAAQATRGDDVNAVPASSHGGRPPTRKRRKKPAAPKPAAAPNASNPATAH